MAQSDEIFDGRMAAVQERLAALLQRATQSPELRAVAAEAVEAVSVSLEELHVATEQLRQQNQELMETRRELEEEQRRYRELFVFAPDGYVVTDAYGTIIEANRAAAALLGVEQEYLAGKPLTVYLAAEDHAAFYSQVQQLRAGEAERLQSEVHLAPRGGLPFPAAMTLAAQRDGQGRLVGLRCLLRDIAERVQAEEALRRTQEELCQANSLLRALLETMPAGVIVADAEGAQLMGNPSGEAILGGPVVGSAYRPKRSYVPYRLDGSPFPPEEMPLVRALEEGEVILGEEILIRRADGSERIILVAAAPVRDEAGHILSGVTVFQDITDLVRAQQSLRKSEQKFRSFIEQSPDAIALVDEDGKLIEWNPAAEEILGLEQAEVLGRPLWDVQFEVALDEQRSPAAYEQLKTDILNSLQTGHIGRPGQLFERDIQPPGGACRTIQPLVFPIQTDQGFMLGSIVRDVTRRRQEQAERERLSAQVAQDRESIGDLAVALDQERDILETIMENTHTQLAYLDPQFNFVRVNSAYAQGSGHAKAELLGRGHFELFPNAENESIFAQVRDTGQPAVFHAKPFEYADQPERGVTYWDWSLVPVQDVTGQVQGLVLSLTEVTDRIRAEKQREEYLACLSKLIQVSERVLAEKSVKGVLQQIVDGARQLAGARLAMSAFSDGGDSSKILAVASSDEPALRPMKEVFDPHYVEMYSALIAQENSIKLTEAEMRADPNWQGLLESHVPLRGLLGTCLVGEDSRANGLILVSDKQHGDFTAQDEALLAQLAALSSLAVQHIKAKDALVHWIAELDATIAAIADGVVVCNPGGGIIRTNLAAERIFGYPWSDRELPLEKWVEHLEIRTADSRPMSAADLPPRRALKGEVVRNVILSARKVQAGGRVWLSMSAAPIQTPDGRILGAVSSFTDITELRRARDELELRVQERTAELSRANETLRYQASLLANVHDAIVATNRQGLISAWNPAAEEMYGWTAEEVLNRPRSEITSMVFVDTNLEDMVRGLAEAGRWRGELRQFRRDGTSLVCEATIVALKDEGGAKSGYVAAYRDISERKWAEEALRERELAYRTLAENLPGIVYRVFIREGHRMQFFNKAAEAVIGYTVEELAPGRVCSLDPLILPEDWARVVAEVECAVSENRPFEVEYRLRHKDGSLRYLLENGTPIYGEDGLPLYIDGVIFDITERVRAEQRLRESEERFRAQYKGIPLPTYTWQKAGEDFILTSYNDAAVAATRGRIADFVGMSASQMFPGRPDILDDFSRCFGERTTIRRELNYSSQFAILEGDFVASYGFVPPDLVMVHIEDITERKRAEEALRQQALIIDQIHDAVVSTDLDGYVTSWNKGAERIMGYPAQEALGRHISFVYPVELHDFLQNEIIAPLQAKGSHEVEVQMRDKAGRVFYTHLSLSLLRDSGGSVRGMIGYTVDITDRKRAEAALRESEERFRRLAENAQDLIYRISFMPTRHFEYVSPAATPMTGYTPKEHYADPDLDFKLVHPEDRPLLMALVQGEVEAGAPLVLRRVRKGGAIIWTEQRSVPIYDEAGNLVALEGIARDITERRLAHQALEARARQQAALAELGQQAVVESDLSRLLDEAVRLIAGTLGVEYCKVLELLPDGQTLLLRAGVGWKEGLVGQVTIAGGSDSQAGFTLASNKPVIVEDLGAETRFQPPPLLADHGVVSGVSVVIQGPDRPFGVLGVHTARRRSFAVDDAHFIQAAAHLLAAAIQRKQAEEILQHYVTRLEVLQKIDRAILSAQSPKGIATVALDYIRDLLVPCQRASLMLFDFEADEAVYLAVSVSNDTGLGAGKRIALDALGDITGLRQGRHAIIDDIRTLATPFPIGEHLLAEGICSYLAVPLLFQGELIGSLSLGAGSPGAFGASHVDVVRYVADPLAIAIQNARLFDQVQAGRERLHILSQRLVEAQEAERQRLSQELHDEAGQALTAVKITLDLIQADLPPQAASLRQSLREAMILTEQTMEQIRLLAHGLRPPGLDAVGLNPTLEDYCRNFARRTRLALRYEGSEPPALSGAITITLYRVLQEALTNIARHADANQVRVKLSYEDGMVTLSVEDDGQGFDPGGAGPSADRRSGIGLVGMLERLELLGGKLEVKSRPGQGTRLVACIPHKEAV